MKAIDLTGRKFGRLTVIERDYSKTNGTYWLCKCDCENKELKSVKASYLKDNKILSCGCLRLERQRKSHKKHNVYDMSNDYGIGSTENGDEFYFDKEDYEKIKDYYWYLNKDGYVISTPFHNSKTILMHRLVMDVSDSKVLVDHIYHHKNDNRKQFLRIVTKSQNAMNSLTPINNIIYAILKFEQVKFYVANRNFTREHRNGLLVYGLITNILVVVVII